jgi:LEA14-like dessication related protein
MKIFWEKILAVLLKLPFQIGLVRRPRLSLEEITIHSISPQNAFMTLNLTVENPNLFPLRVGGVDYFIYLNGYKFAEGSIYNPKLPFRLPRRGISLIEIPIRLNFLKIGAGIRTVLLLGKISSQIEARMQIQSPLGIIPLTVSQSGQHRVFLPEIARDHYPEPTYPEIQPDFSIH